ncbi:hypothetical protein ABS71_06595 [bacterium SCN 62-11]|nr:MAG: hypothetical protein ABS71_06595 [bacterium SCN 62-11]
MPTIERSELDDLKDRVDLVELFRGYGLEPRKKGRSWFCRCPFHDDSTASLSITPQERLWNCFGCQAGGDALEFLRLKEDLDFPDALARLRERAGQTAGQDEAPAPKQVPEDRRSELLGRVGELYRKRFQEAPQGREYLTGRGLCSPELWKAFGVGFCDGTLKETLPNDGPLLESLKTLGVLTADGKEHFRGCVVVPLTFPDQGVVGFYGRRIRPDAKFPHLYLPGPHRGVLNWQGLRASTSVTLTESVLDALSFWQAGARSVSCLFGCQNLPEPLVELMQRYGTQEVTWALDGDRAGLEAAQRLSPQLRQQNIRVFTVRLPDDQDPNQVLQEQGPEPLFRLLDRTEKVSEAQEPAAAQTAADGLSLELRGVQYDLKMMGPFGQRLRANLRARKDGKRVQDRFDLMLHRDRMRLVQQLVSQMGLARMEAERQVQEVLQAAEDFAQQRQVSQDSAPATLSDDEKQAALSWLRQPQLARAILNDTENLGYVGEESAKLLVYLIGISRKLPKPLSGIILSQSGCGKSSLTELLERLTPPEDILVFTRITAQALLYMPEGMLKHKVLIVEERTGAEAAEYPIRILQSSQRLQQAVPHKDPSTGKITTQVISVEGPAAYLETTTDPKINHENATRCFEITLDESLEQTERIHQAQRRQRLPGPNRQRLAEQIYKRHHHAQRLLEPLLVFIPYVEKIVFPAHKLRNRRDHERFLCLIETSAFLHQAQRPRGQTDEGDAYVLASIEDYALAYTLAKDVLAQTLHELTRQAKDVWQMVRDWLVGHAGQQARETTFTRRDLRQVTGVEDHQLRATLQELVEMEYLEVVSAATGRAFQYRLLVLSEDDIPMPLLTPAELAKRI